MGEIHGILAGFILLMEDVVVEENDDELLARLSPVYVDSGFDPAVDRVELAHQTE